MTGQTLFRREIEEQPRVLESLLGSGRGPAQAIARAVAAFAPNLVLIAARGSSDNAARYAQYLFGNRHRMPVALATPSLFGAYQTPPRIDSAWVIGVSQSGQSPDVVEVVAEGRRQGALTLAITNTPDSPLGRAAEWTLPLGAGSEQAVAASKTYLAQLFAFSLLSAALESAQQGSFGAWEELRRIPALVEQTVRRCESVEQAVSLFAESSSALVLGRGYNYSTAFELALKLKETCQVWAQPYSPADFLHGPLALLTKGLPVLWVAPSSPVLQVEEGAPLLQLLEARDARRMVISDRPELLGRAQLAVPLPAGVPEWLSPLSAVLPGQCFAEALARHKGLDPDRPPGLTKVTRTR
jgi:glucosamine--fructose-6-phosphate aminotransferase (isomerizing)